MSGSVRSGSTSSRELELERMLDGQQQVIERMRSQLHRMDEMEEKMGFLLDAFITHRAQLMTRDGHSQSGIHSGSSAHAASSSQRGGGGAHHHHHHQQQAQHAQGPPAPINLDQLDTRMDSMENQLEWMDTMKTKMDRALAILEDMDARARANTSSNAQRHGGNGQGQNQWPRT